MPVSNLLTAAIVDNNSDIYPRCKAVLEQFGFSKIYEHSSLDLTEASLEKWNLLICDICLEKDILSFKQLQESDCPFSVIYLSSYTDFVFDLFDTNVLGFVTKPNLEEDLPPLIKRFFRRFKKNRIVVFQTWYSKTEFVQSQIEYIEKIDGQILLWSVNKPEPSVLTERSMRTVAEKLSDEQFLSISQSCIVAISSIVRIDLLTNEAILKSNRRLSVSRRKMRTLINAWKRNSLCMS